MMTNIDDLISSEVAEFIETEEDFVNSDIAPRNEIYENGRFWADLEEEIYYLDTFRI